MSSQFYVKLRLLLSSSLAVANSMSSQAFPSTFFLCIHLILL
ncbi:hypothetical protein Patl1_16649 [Pistacia atlantica]|uniref:Uncharacterized protein n=1 Tax=Pistacia atlantica TaxID=434234 RepID=A0ACC1B7L1_9ROSI|nr:hypothetical protein Patl1_16649 [Pistacia atlantica]